MAKSSGHFNKKQIEDRGRKEGRPTQSLADSCLGMVVDFPASVFASYILNMEAKETRAVPPKLSFLRQRTSKL